MVWLTPIDASSLASGGSPPLKITLCDLEARCECQISSAAFTEHGASMAATVLNPEPAVQMSIFVVRAS